MHTLTDTELTGLLLWFSPAFPTGSFAYSHGLEQAVEAGWVRNAGDLAAWLSDLLAEGSLACEARLFHELHRARRRHDLAAVEWWSDLAIALQPGEERRLESVRQGEAFVRALGTGWPELVPADLRARLPDRLPLVAATAAITARAGIPPVAAARAHLLAALQALVWAAVRLVPLSQSDALSVIALLQPAVSRLAARPPDRLGCATLRSDIASLAHETQHTRLFRS